MAWAPPTAQTSLDAEQRAPRPRPRRRRAAACTRRSARRPATWAGTRRHDERRDESGSARRRRPSAAASSDARGSPRARPPSRGRAGAGPRATCAPRRRRPAPRTSGMSPSGAARGGVVPRRPVEARRPLAPPRRRRARARRLTISATLDRRRRSRTGALTAPSARRGRVRIDDAPHGRGAGSSDQIAAAGTSACTATSPGVARSMTVGDPRVGSSAVTSSRRSCADVEQEVAVGPRVDHRRRAASSACGAPRGRSSRAADQHRLGLEEHAERCAARWCAACCRSRPGRRSRRPARGAARSRPTRRPARSRPSTPRSPSRRAARRGCDVATRRPARSASAGAASSRGTAACSEHAPEAQAQQDLDVEVALETRSSPVMPQSTMPSWTYSGTSSARTKSRSISALRQCDLQDALARLLGVDAAGLDEQRPRRLAQPPLGRQRQGQAAAHRRPRSTARYPPSP